HVYCVTLSINTVLYPTAKRIARFRSIIPSFGNDLTLVSANINPQFFISSRPIGTRPPPTAEVTLPLYIYKYKIKIHHVLSGQLIESQIVIGTNITQQKEATL
ncbi:MAG: hypothetical protein ABSH41_31135, partial [Syntrophobacteraceae bacterium]